MKTTVQQFLTVIVIILLSLNLFVNGMTAEKTPPVSDVKTFYGKNTVDDIKQYIENHPRLSVKAVAVVQASNGLEGIVVME